MNSVLDQLATIKTKVENAMGLGQPKMRDFQSAKPAKQADKDSLRWSQAWFNQWDDERTRNVMIANVARDDAGYWNAIGFSHHPVNASFGQLPATINAVPAAQRHAFLNSPETMRNIKPRFDWDLYN